MFLVRYGSDIIHKPIAERNAIAITEDSALLIDPDSIVPEKAAINEITKVMNEIQRFVGVVILTPRMLYAILTPILSKLFVKAMRKVYKTWCMSMDPYTSGKEA